MTIYEESSVPVPGGCYLGHGDDIGPYVFWLWSWSPTQGGWVSWCDHEGIGWGTVTPLWWHAGSKTRRRLL